MSSEEHVDKKQKVSPPPPYDFRKVENDLFVIHFVKNNRENRLSQQLCKLFPDSNGDDAILKLWSDYARSRHDEVVKIIRRIIRDDPGDGDFDPLAVPELARMNPQLIDSAWDAAKAGVKKSIEKVLEQRSIQTEDAKKEAGTGIFAIQAEIDGIQKIAYYVSGGGAGRNSVVDFRHGGESGREPPIIYRRDLSKESGVHAFCSSSGSGKTVELVGSALTRNCHLAIVLAPTDGQFQKEDDERGQEVVSNNQDRKKGLFIEEKSVSVTYIIQFVTASTRTKYKTALDGL